MTVCTKIHISGSCLEVNVKIFKKHCNGKEKVLLKEAMSIYFGVEWK